MEQTNTKPVKTVCGWTKVCEARHVAVLKIEEQSKVELTRRQARKILQRRLGER